MACPSARCGLCDPDEYGPVTEHTRFRCVTYKRVLRAKNLDYRDDVGWMRRPTNARCEPSQRLEGAV